MEGLVTTHTLSREDLESIFRCVVVRTRLCGSMKVACSFQGTGTRTRTTFMQALSQLGLSHVDLPVFLDTSENLRDLAGYLDVYYDLYVIRYRDHERLSEFNSYSKRPVINAMSCLEHPCEAIADAYWFQTKVKGLKGATVVLWGPLTNVLRSWRNVATAAGAEAHVVLDPAVLPPQVDLVVTDGFPEPNADAPLTGLSLAHLEKMGTPMLLPTPPFTVGRELLFDPLEYARFSGYAQKRYLLDVQKAIIFWIMGRHQIRETDGDASAATISVP